MDCAGPAAAGSATEPGGMNLIRASGVDIPLLSTRRPGRPADPDLTNRLITAAVGILAERGWAALNADRLATLTRSGKAAIYRRWPNMTSLAASAIGSLSLVPHVSEFCPAFHTRTAHDCRGKELPVVVEQLLVLNAALCRPLTWAERAVGATISAGLQHAEIAAALTVAVWEPLDRAVVTIMTDHASPPRPGITSDEPCRALSAVCRGLWTRHLTGGPRLSKTELRAVMTMALASA